MPPKRFKSMITIERERKGYARAINICLILGDINQAEGFLDKLSKANPDIKSLKFREGSNLEEIKTCHLEIDKL